uniref:Uncharacterized protein n=1 Tax=Trichogramma kaykai TaxID=54128 RepID=A0ABD2W1Z0_9HYME
MRHKALHFHASTRPAALTVHGALTHRRRRRRRLRLRLRLRGRRRLRRQAPLVDFSLWQRRSSGLHELEPKKVGGGKNVRKERRSKGRRRRRKSRFIVRGGGAMSHESACGGGHMQRYIIANLRTYAKVCCTIVCRFDNSIVNFERPSVPVNLTETFDKSAEPCAGPAAAAAAVVAMMAEKVILKVRIKLHKTFIEVPIFRRYFLLPKLLLIYLGRTIAYLSSLSLSFSPSLLLCFPSQD